MEATEEKDPRKSERWTKDLRDGIIAVARDTGFALAGVAVVPEEGDQEFEKGASRFESWAESGHAGEMAYLQRRDEKGHFLRGGLQRAIPWAKSVVVCAFHYNWAGPTSLDPASTRAGWIARYAWMGRNDVQAKSEPADYHDDLLRRLRRVEAALIDAADCTTRSYVDTGPILERDFAARAGIGWVGKNTCVLNQQFGSWLLLGVVVTSLAMEEVQDRHAELPAADRCGTCTRCIDACPTDALLAGRDPGSLREMDASRCISYLTIEKKGSATDSLREGIGRNVFGCDICQEVCPWNRRSPIAASGAAEVRTELINPTLEWLAAMDNAEFRRRFQGSPLERTGRKRVLRNVAIAMGNSADSTYLGRLEEWINEPGEGTGSVALREAAEWARSRISALNEAPEQGGPSASLVGDADRRAKAGVDNG